MKAVLCKKYGPPEVLHLGEVMKPTPKENQVQIKIHSTAVTASDCIIRKFDIPTKSWLKGKLMSFMMGFVLGFKKPKKPVLGLVLSGEIESVGKEIKNYKAGDEVYAFTGFSFGAYAEYICLKETDSKSGCMAIKPKTMSHDETAAISYGGCIAIHFLREGKIQPGQKVMIYGASGAIGTAAVQIAKHWGAEVTGVCSERNLEMVQSLGADKVIDYTSENAVAEMEEYDLIFDAVGEVKRSELKDQCKKNLNKKGKYISVDSSSLRLKSEYLNQLTDMVDKGHVIAVIDKIYPIEEIVEAHRYVDGKHKRGNVVIKI